MEEIEQESRTVFGTVTQIVRPENAESYIRDDITHAANENGYSVLVIRTRDPPWWADIPVAAPIVSWVTDADPWAKIVYTYDPDAEVGDVVAIPVFGARLTGALVEVTAPQELRSAQNETLGEVDPQEIIEELNPEGEHR